MNLEAAFLRILRTWWRPLAAVGIGATIWVNGVLLPWIRQDWPDLTGLAALVTAVAAAFAVREWGKVKGSDEE